MGVLLYSDLQFVGMHVCVSTKAVTYHNGGLAQSVERSVRNRQAGGSKPPSSTFFLTFSVPVYTNKMDLSLVPSTPYVDNVSEWLRSWF